jgi:hypothetical protein
MDKIANKIARPIETITKSISHAMNLSVHLANLISLGDTSDEHEDSFIADNLMYSYVMLINITSS